MKRRFILLFFSICLASLSVSAQQTEDESVVRLLQADRAHQWEEFGIKHREVVGQQATFFHNNTYLLCDSASWNVNAGIIEAYGNVQIVQNTTRLKSENLTYFIDQNLARFGGGLIELTDIEGNLLRTTQLDYNTKDSVATFNRGAAMRDTSGNVMESLRGNYDSKIHTFTFEHNVEVYTDTSMLKTEMMRYVTDVDKAFFYENTYAWRGDGFVKANGGWYDTGRHILSFNNDVFMDNPDYEAWAQEVYYYQDTSIVEMRDHVQILDTASKAVILSEYATYDRNTGKAILTDNPTIVYFGENEDHIVDTLFVRADTMLFYSVMKSTIEESEIQEAAKRKSDLLYDSLSVQREEQAKKRQDEWVTKMQQYGRLPMDYDPEDPDGSKKRAADSLAAVAARDSLAAIAVQDSLAAVVSSDDFIETQIYQTDSISSVLMPTDSLSLQGFQTDSLLAQIPQMDSLSLQEFQTDSLSENLPLMDSVPPPDTSIRYVFAHGDIRMYRSDIQAKCDNVTFCELDSIAIMTGNPVLWNAEKNQLTSTTMQLLMQDGNVTRGAMLENAMITTNEDSLHFNQIKSTEMTGYFHDNELYRFDALGGVSAIFYLVENDRLTTLNKKESRSLTAVIKDGNAEKMLYTESIKSDAYPITDMAIEEQRLTGFQWRGDERPVSRYNITDRELYQTERDNYTNITKPVYRYVNQYFDNMMKDVVKTDATRAGQLNERISIQSRNSRVSHQEEVEDTD